MSNFLEKIKFKLKRFTTKSVGHLQPAAELFAPLDKEALIFNIQLKEKAKTNGKNSIPSVNDRSDACETEIEAECKLAQSRYLSDYNSQIQVYTDRIEKYKSDINLENIDVEQTNNLQNLQQTMTEENSYLYKDQETLKAKSREILNFRHKHKLMGRLPDFINPIVIYSVLAVIILTEFILNIFLLQGSGNQLATATHALIFVVVNVLVPFILFSKSHRYWWHINPLKKLFALIMLCIFIVYACFLNLMMGHYRATIEENMAAMAEGNLGALADFQRSSEIALQNLINEPFGLGVMAWVLCAIGLFCCIAAFLDGLAQDDNYPGYGHLKRDFDEKYEENIEAIENAIETLKERRDKANKSINIRKQDLEREFNHLPSQINAAQGLYSRYIQAIKILQADYKSLIDLYRQENRLARTDGNIPEFFNMAPQDLNESDVARSFEFDADSVPDPQSAIERLSRHADKITETFDEEISTIHSLKNVLDDDFPFRVERNYA